jgi:hypothetical protein
LFKRCRVQTTQHCKACTDGWSEAVANRLLRLRQGALDGRFRFSAIIGEAELTDQKKFAGRGEAADPTCYWGSPGAAVLLRPGWPDSRRESTGPVQRVTLVALVLSTFLGVDAQPDWLGLVAAVRRAVPAVKPNSAAKEWNCATATATRSSRPFPWSPLPCSLRFPPSSPAPSSPLLLGVSPARRSGRARRDTGDGRRRRRWW